MQKDRPTKRSLGQDVRDLIRSCTAGALATRYETAGSSWPFASLVLTAFDTTGAPLLLLSELALHTQNLRNDANASLLLEKTQGLADPLVGARVTLIGTVSSHDDPLAVERYCRRHPSAEMYRNFKDFHLFRMQITKAHLVAGFGEIHWVEGEDILLRDDECRPIGQSEDEVVRHMNDDHADAVNLIARHFGNRKVAQGKQSPEEWIMTGLDPEGADFRFKERFCRISFTRRVKNPADIRNELVRLTKKARSLENL
ncbi:MAG: DUF2470 domain-containing protein [Kiloniellales bacterium]|nr:DUF2470 domain-containing protein [Kiloniellales bacterium]